MTTQAITLNPGAVLGQDHEKTVWPTHPEDLHIPVFDTGVFINEMAKLQILPRKLDKLTDNDKLALQQNPENLLEKAQAQAPDSEPSLPLLRYMNSSRKGTAIELAQCTKRV